MSSALAFISKGRWQNTQDNLPDNYSRGVFSIRVKLSFISVGRKVITYFMCIPVSTLARMTCWPSMMVMTWQPTSWASTVAHGHTSSCLPPWLTSLFNFSPTLPPISTATTMALWSTSLVRLWLPFFPLFGLEQTGVLNKHIGNFFYWSTNSHLLVLNSHCKPDKKARTGNKCEIQNVTLPRTQQVAN